ncbi:Uncharacterised protein [Vibrio cholerae]|nr:Uncharacterised protein [Vibrio cholerae]
MGNMENIKQLLINFMPNARLRGWQRITTKPNTTTATTAAQWDWERCALTVPLEAFVKLHFQDYNDPIKDHIKDRLNDH